jgi:hypothetical protein
MAVERGLSFVRPHLPPNSSAQLFDDLDWLIHLANPSPIGKNILNQPEVLFYFLPINPCFSILWPRTLLAIPEKK